ncbi:MAG: lyase family protein, partial [Actinomycetota bacterium]|nr:lyase family protein [Actinomycetota bacterium]
MIGRYSLPEMARLWTDEHKLEVWKEVESAALEAWVKAGTVPSEALLAVRRAPTPTPAEVLAREKITDHDLAAFVDLLAGASGEMGRWVHFGLTSSDVLDTALGVVLAEAGDLLAASVAAVFETVRRRALEEKDTVILGRTHGVWAEPTSLGLKLASWAFELSRAHERMVRATAVAAVGKISGAVGSYAHSPPEIEAFVCQQLGLGIEPASTQVTARDRHAEFLLAIALVGASLERMATEIRHLQRSEVREMREPFS